MINSKISKQIVSKDVQAIVKELDSLPEVSTVDQLKPKIPFPDQQKLYDLSKIKKNVCQSFCKLLDTSFLIRYGKESLLDQIQPVITHLEPGEKSTYDLVIDIAEDGGKFLIIHNEEILYSCRKVSELAPLVISEITRLAYQRTDFLMVFHSAVVGNEQSCIILPGLSGVGKSTLTAALVHSGFDYFTDEVALLKRHTHKVLPIPTSIGIKENSWEVLSPIYPVINKLPIYSGIENRRIRFLTPAPNSIASSLREGKPAQSVIFPKYIPNRSTSIQQLGKVETLKQLAEVGYQTRNELDPEKVNELVKWISGIHCYQIQYSSLPDAVKTIWRVFNEHQS